MAVRPDFVTETLPVVPAATTAVMLVALATLKDEAAVPPKLTADALAKFAPVIVTVVPVPADEGLNEVMAGALAEKVNPARVPMPTAVVTVTLPLVPAATTAVMVSGLTTVNDVADVPPNFTDEELQKPVPVMVTVCPVAAVVGVNEVIVGTLAADSTKLLTLVAVPAGVVTDIVPDAPQGTVAVIWVALFTVNATAAVPPKLTAVAPVKLVPVIISVVAPAANGVVMPLTVGTAVKVNPANVAVPAGVVTEALPVVPLATTAFIVVELITANEVAAVPPKLTAVAPVKLVPVIITVAPAAADVGENEVTVGAANVNPANVAVPEGVVTEIIPVVLPATTAVMLVALATLNEATATLPVLTAVAPVKLLPVIAIVPPTATGEVNAVIIGAALNALVV